MKNTKKTGGEKKKEWRGEERNNKRKGMKNTIGKSDERRNKTEEKATGKEEWRKI